MSIRAISWARECLMSLDLSPSERLVLIALADAHNGPTGLCCPSLETLGRFAGVNRRNARVHLRTLEARGLIRALARTVGGKQTTNAYELKMGEEGGRQRPPKEGAEGGRQRPPSLGDKGGRQRPPKEEREGGRRVPPYEGEEGGRQRPGGEVGSDPHNLNRNLSIMERGEIPEGVVDFEQHKRRSD